MGCSSTKTAAPAGGESSEPVAPAELRRRLSLGEIDAGDGTISWKVSQQDGALLTQLMQQSIFDFLPDEGTTFQDSELEGCAKRYSLGSVQMDTLPQNSFQNKHVTLEGDQQYQFDSSKEQVGFACKKGLKPEAPNQDSFCILKFNAHALYGVFDGHGRKGHEVSNFVKDSMPKILLSQEKFETDPEKALLITFEKMQSLITTATAMKIIDATRSGSTCSLVLHCLKKNTLYIAHVGDTRCVLGRKPSDTVPVQAVDLTVDHKPDLPAERARIEKAGGVVIFDGGWNYRVFAKDKKDSRGKRYPGLNMSRAMGDLNGFNDAGISAIPEVSKHEVEASKAKDEADVPGRESDVPGLTGESKLQDAGRETTAPTSMNVDAGAASISSHGASSASSHGTPSVSSFNLNPSSDKFLLIASDGVWEFISSEEAVQEVSQFAPNQAGTAAEHLAALSWDRWMLQMGGQVVDDITALVVYL